MPLPEGRGQAGLDVAEGRYGVRVGLQGALCAALALALVLAILRLALDVGVEGDHGLLVVEVEVGPRVLLAPSNVHVAIWIESKLAPVEVVVDVEATARDGEKSLSRRAERKDEEAERAREEGEEDQSSTQQLPSAHTPVD